MAFASEKLALFHVAKDDIIAELRAHLNRAQKQARYYKSQALVAVGRAKEAEREKQALLACLNFRPELRNIIIFGGCSLALKRNSAGHVGGRACASLVAGDDERGYFSDKKVFLLV